MTLDRHLLLVAALEDAQFARSFAKRIGGDLKRARTTLRRARVRRRRHRRPRPDREAHAAHHRHARRRHALAARGPRSTSATTASSTSSPSAAATTASKIDLGDGVDTLIHEGTDGDDRIEVRGLTGVEYVDVNAGDGDDSVTIDAIDDLWEVHTDLGAADGDLDRVDRQRLRRATTRALGQRVQRPRERARPARASTFDGAEPTDRLRLNGNGGEDIVSASTDVMKLTLDGGDDTDVVLGGPGRDTADRRRRLRRHQGRPR